MSHATAQPSDLQATQASNTCAAQNVQQCTNNTAASQPTSGMVQNDADDEADTVRPSEEAARKAIEAFLDKELPDYPTYSLCQDGDTGWAFWVTPDDTTSYLKEDLSIEWYGSAWPDSCEYDGLTGKWLPVAA